MSLTAAQLVTLKATIVGNATLMAFLPASPGALADYANAVPDTGATQIYRPSITVDELKGSIDWSVFATLSVPAQNTYLAMSAGQSVDATKASIRAGFATVFGSGPTLTALTALAQRPATRLEALFSTAGISAVFGQRLTTDDVLKAMAS